MQVIVVKVGIPSIELVYIYQRKKIYRIENLILNEILVLGSRLRRSLHDAPVPHCDISTEGLKRVPITAGLPLIKRSQSSHQGV